MRCILALDQGTTSSRALLIGHDGAVQGLAQKALTPIFPRPGWVEHDPAEIWASQAGVAAEILSRARRGPGDVAAVGIANQRETTIVWGRRTGAPIYNAIGWQDRRTAAFCDGLREAGHEETFRSRTGLVLDAYFSGPKVRWILDHVPGARGLAEAGHLAFGTVDAWLVWKLTGGRLHLTDLSNASRTLLFNIHTGAWDDELLGLVGVPASMLPEVRSSSEVYGEVSGDVLPGRVPIAGIAGDQQAATFGQRCVEPGLAKCTYGTGCFMLMHTGAEPVPSANNLLTTVAWKLGEAPTEFALEGSVFMGGAVVQWLRDGLGLIRRSEDIEALALSVESSGGVVLVPAFAGLGAPHWDPHARGTIVGLTRGTTAGHLARAALEGIAFQVADVLEAMEKDAGQGVRELRVDGGAAGNSLLMQIQADVLGAPLVRPASLEATALGAAYLAGLAVGFWGSAEEVSAQWALGRRFSPEASPEARATMRKGWGRALARSRGWEPSG